VCISVLAGLKGNVDKARRGVVGSRMRSKLGTFQAEGFEIRTAHAAGYCLTRPLAIRA